jgi:hypothetical protein
MRHLVVLLIHFLATLVRLLGPGSLRSIVAESLLLKHQLLLLIVPGNDRRIYPRRTVFLPAGWHSCCRHISGSPTVRPSGRRREGSRHFSAATSTMSDTISSEVADESPLVIIDFGLFAFFNGLLWAIGPG